MPEKNIPQPVQAALAAIESLKDSLSTDQAQELQKRLPGYAMQLAKGGAAVTPAMLCDAINAGVDFAAQAQGPAQKQQRTYESVMLSLRLGRKNFSSLPDELMCYLEAGDIPNIDRFIQKYAGRYIEGYGKNYCSYRTVTAGSFRRGNLDLLKHALAQDPELQKDIIYMAACLGYAAEAGHMHMLRYVLEDLGLADAVRSKMPGLCLANLKFVDRLLMAVKGGHGAAVDYIFPDLFERLLKLHPRSAAAFFHASLESEDTAYIQKFLDAHIGTGMDVGFYLTCFYRASPGALSYLLEKKFFKPWQKIEMLKRYEEGSRDARVPPAAPTIIQSLRQDDLGPSDLRSAKEVLVKLRAWADHVNHKGFADICGEALGLAPSSKEYIVAKEWERVLGHIPADLRDRDPRLANLPVLRDVYKMLKEDNPGELAAWKYAYNTARLFRSTDQVLKYLEKWGKFEGHPLHDVLYMINPPPGDFDIKGWGDAIMQQGPGMAKLIAFADKIPQPLRSDDGSVYSLQKTRMEAARFVYKNAWKNPELAQLCFELLWTQGVFSQALGLTEKYREKYAANDNRKREGRIPDIILDGDSFGLPGCTFRKLADGDARGLALGEYTDCCQHLANAGAECAAHGFLSEDGGFYVVEDKHGKIIGQTWAWRGEDGEMVFDSLEYLTARMKPENWKKICDGIARQLRENAGDITALNVGTGGKTPQNIFNKAAQPARPKAYAGYRDSTTQYHVWKKK